MKQLGQPANRSGRALGGLGRDEEARSCTEGNKLNGVLWRRVRKLGSHMVLQSDLMAYLAGDLCIVPPGGATRNERSFEEERHRTSRQREWTTNHPLATRERGIAGKWDQFPRISIEQHGSGGFLPSTVVPPSSPHPNQRHLIPSRALRYCSHTSHDKRRTPRHMVIRMSNYDATTIFRSSRSE